MNTMNKIIIRATNWVGDAVLNLPAISQLRKIFPKAEISVVTRPWVADIFKHNPDINEVIVIDDKKNPLDYFKLIFRLRKKKFDLAILLPNSFSAAFFAYIIGAKKRIGYNTDKRGFFLTNKIEQTPEILRTHQVEYYMNIIKQLRTVDETREFKIVINEEESDSMKKKLHQAEIDSNTFLIGINPGAFYGSAKRWFPDRFAKVIDYIHKKYNAKFILTGSKKDKPINAEILQTEEVTTLHNKGIVLDWAGKTTLRELIALISNLKAFITNDSGAMHIAAALNIPLIAIFGSTDWITTPPYSKNHIIVRKDTPCAPCLLRDCPKEHECMKKIYVEDVVNAFEKISDK